MTIPHEPGVGYYLSPGQLFAGRYLVDGFLAEGGMGAVFAGHHVATEMRVAIKVLRPSVLSAPAAIRQFELEAKVAARVKSDFIVQVFDAGTDEATGLHYLVMELLEGESLESLVRRQGALPPALILSLLQQVAQGLDRAHSHADADGVLRPIVHRDLKPDNIFITQSSAGGTVAKILDFGIAKVLSATSGVSQDLRGTPLYMAPEQAAAQAITPQTDVWALGLITFYCLAGGVYWKGAMPGGTLVMLLNEITQQPLEAASARSRALGFHSDWPPAFDAWFARCLQRDPLARFPSAGAAWGALQTALGPAAGAVDTSPFVATELGGGAQVGTQPPAPRDGVVDTATHGAFSASSTPDRVSSARNRWLAGVALLVVGAGAAALAMGLGGETESGPPGIATSSSAEVGTLEGPNPERVGTPLEGDDEPPAPGSAAASSLAPLGAGAPSVQAAPALSASAVPEGAPTLGRRPKNGALSAPPVAAGRTASPSPPRASAAPPASVESRRGPGDPYGER